MISDPSNIDLDKAEQEPEPESKPNLRAAWEHRGDPESKPESPVTPLGIAWFGIVLAAACYPIVITIISVVYSMVAYGVVRLPVHVIGMAVMFLTISFIIGMIYGAVMAVPAFLLTRLLSWSLQGMVSDRGASGIFGGLTGFLSISGCGLFFVDGTSTFRSWEQWLFFVSMPVAAIVMGYVGAIWAGYLKRNEGFPFYEPIFSLEKQITILYLMQLTLVVAVLAVGFKAAGAGGVNVGTAWLIYLLLQILLLVCDHGITRWLSWHSRSFRR